MKNSNLFWGFFFLSLGSLILLAKYDVIDSGWYFIWELWPVILIFWGLMLLVKTKYLKSFIVILFGIIFGFLIYGTVANLIDEASYTFSVSESDATKTDFFESYDSSFQVANLKIEGGAGKIYVTGSSNNLVEGNSYGKENLYVFSKRVKGNKVDLNFDTKIKKIKFLNGNYKNNLNLRLNESPLWYCDFSVGAVKADFDLSELKVKKIHLASGISSLKIKLGDELEKTYLKADVGLTKLKVYVPVHSGVKVTSDGFLISKSIEDFYRNDYGDYFSDNFEISSNKVYINTEGAFTKLSIERY